MLSYGPDAMTNELVPWPVTTMKPIFQELRKSLSILEYVAEFFLRGAIFSIVEKRSREAALRIEVDHQHLWIAGLVGPFRDQSVSEAQRERRFSDTTLAVHYTYNLAHLDAPNRFKRRAIFGRKATG